MTDADLHARYTRDGFVRLPALLDGATLAELCRECDRLAADPGLLLRETPGVPLRRDLDGRPSPDRLDPVAPLSLPMAALRDDPSIRNAVAGVLGCAVLPFKDKLHLKPPRTHGYELHQDFATWVFMDLPPEDLATLVIAIDECTAENGALELFAGCHGEQLPGPRGAPLDVAPSSIAVPGTLMPLRAGDALLLHSLAPHRSAPNRSDGPRRALFLTYVAARHGPQRERYYRERAAALHHE